MQDLETLFARFNQEDETSEATCPARTSAPPAPLRFAGQVSKAVRLWECQGTNVTGDPTTERAHQVVEEVQ